MTIWTYEEAARFRAATRGHQFYPLFLLTMSTGMRLSEVLGLRWIDVQGNRVHVRHTATEVDGELYFAETTKTDHSTRLISISQDVVDALDAHRQDQKARYRKLGFVPEHGLVFDSGVGTPLFPRNLERTFVTLKRRAEVPHVTFHDLRHWHASMLIEQGVDIRLIAKRLGHAGPHITLRTYVHLFDRDQQVEAISLDDILPELEDALPRFLN
jgi:integrase